MILSPFNSPQRLNKDKDFTTSSCSLESETIVCLRVSILIAVSSTKAIMEAASLAPSMMFQGRRVVEVDLWIDRMVNILTFFGHPISQGAVLWLDSGVCVEVVFL